jgi:Glycosyltransferase family 17
VTRIFDCFPWAGELDILECRLRELDSSAVYRHVLVESPVTHRGPAKTLDYLEHEDRFAPWADRIIHVVADLDPGTSWGNRIAAQRDAVRDGLSDADGDDIVILSDVDEIITPLAVQVAARGEHVCFRQRFALFCVDWEVPHPWDGPSAARLRDVDTFAGFRITGSYTDEGAGWHLSWLGGPAAGREKLGRYGHAEKDTEIGQGLRDGRFLLRGDTWEGQCTARVVNENWPRWVFERQCPPEWFREHWA